MTKLKSQVSFLILVGILMIGTVQSYVQELILRDKFSDEAPILTTLTSHVSNLTLFPELQNVTYICGTGFWLSYHEPNYIRWAGVAWGGGSELRCAVTAFPSSGSIRFGGAANTDDQMASLYAEESWVGQETAVTGQELAQVSAQSIVISGTRSWTIFEGENFQGRSQCITPESDSQIKYYFSVSYYFNFTGISSIMKGC